MPGALTIPSPRHTNPNLHEAPAARRSVTIRLRTIAFGGIKYICHSSGGLPQVFGLVLRFSCMYNVCVSVLLYDTYCEIEHIAIPN